MKEVFHVIRSARRTFTRDEWNDYLQECRNGVQNRIQTKKGKYVFNDCDVCLNPDNESVVVKGSGANGYSATIKIANSGNGIWSFGYDYFDGTGGGSSGASYADKKDTRLWNKGFESERECRKFAWRYLLTRLEPIKERNKEVGRLYAAVEQKFKEYSRPKVVQLELF